MVHLPLEIIAAPTVILIEIMHIKPDTYLMHSEDEETLAITSVAWTFECTDLSWTSEELFHYGKSRTEPLLMWQLIEHKYMTLGCEASF